MGGKELHELILSYDLFFDKDTAQRDLALILDNLGFSKVRILVNGWTVWQNGGLPVEAGN